MSNAIHLHDLQAALAALQGLHPLLNYSRLMVFTDDEAIKAALVSLLWRDATRRAGGVYQDRPAPALAHAGLKRGPSLSNPADAPPRNLPLTAPSSLATREPTELKAPNGHIAAATASPRA